MLTPAPAGDHEGLVLVCVCDPELWFTALKFLHCDRQRNQSFLRRGHCGGAGERGQYHCEHVL